LHGVRLPPAGAGCGSEARRRRGSGRHGGLPARVTHQRIRAGRPAGAVRARTRSVAGRDGARRPPGPGVARRGSDHPLRPSAGGGAERRHRERAVRRLSTRRDRARRGAAGGAHVYWAGQVRIQRFAASAWLARRTGDTAEALRLAAAAADLEDVTQKHPVTPGAVLPARELLGDLLLELGRPADAARAYAASLAQQPNRARSLFGAARAAELAGDVTVARARYREYLTLMEKSDGGRGELEIAGGARHRGARRRRGRHPSCDPPGRAAPGPAGAAPRGSRVRTAAGVAGGAHPDRAGDGAGGATAGARNPAPMAGAVRAPERRRGD